MYEKRRLDEFQLLSCKWSNSSQTTMKPEDAMPKDGFVMRFFSCARWGVGVVGAERSIQAELQTHIHIVPSLTRRALFIIS